MTGFASVEGNTKDKQITVEIRSVNSRFLDTAVSLPPFLSAYEKEVLKIVASKFKRGKVDVSIRVTGGVSRRLIDTAAAASYKDDIIMLASKLNLARPSDEKILSLVLSNEEVIKDFNECKTGEGSVKEDWESIKDVLIKAVDICAKDRAREGDALEKDIASKILVLEKCAKTFEEWMPRMEERFQNIIIEHFRTLMGENVDMGRVTQEVAALMVRYTINEEVVRLISHIAALKTELASPYPGKKLDFICQEAGREINTIGSKNPFADISAVVVDAKDALEAIREQTRNVE